MGRIWLNEVKPNYVKFSTKKYNYIAVMMNNQKNQHVNVAKYLGLTLDKLRRKTHVKDKPKSDAIPSCQYTTNCFFISEF